MPSDAVDNDKDTPEGQDAPENNDDSFDFDSLPENVKTHIRALRGEAKGYRLDKRDLEQQLTDTNSKLSSTEESRKKELERRGDYESISRQQEQELAELKIKAGEGERYREAVEATNAQRIEQLPEHLRDLVPDVSPDAKAAWLDTALPKLTVAPIPDINAGAGGSGGSGKTTAKLSSDEKKIAAASGMTDEEWLVAKTRANIQ